MAKDWFYSMAGQTVVGDMVCSHCRTRIENSEEFRCYDTGDGYRVQHRKCSTDDQGWKLHDRRNQLQLQLAEAKLKAYRDFAAMWDEGALEDAIAQQEAFVNTLRMNL